MPERTVTPQPSETPEIEVVIEVPRGSFIKRGFDRVDFVSPFPCPFNYGAVHAYVGADHDPLDAVVLGPYVHRGETVVVNVRASIRFMDDGIPDDKLICSRDPLTHHDRRLVISFFHVYAFCKRLLNVARGMYGRTACDGWDTVEGALSRARFVKDPERNRPPPSS